MRTAESKYRAVRLAAGLAALSAALGPATARAACVAASPGMTYEMPGSDISVSCGDGSCDVAVGGVRVAEVRTWRDPVLCDTTAKETEASVPRSCVSAYRRSGLSVRQALASGGKGEVILDVFQPPASSRPSAAPLRPRAECVPRYQEKRGDVWQFSAAGGAGATAIRAFEEDEASPGHGNSSRDHRPVPSFTLTARSPRPGPETVANFPKAAPASPVRPVSVTEGARRPDAAASMGGDPGVPKSTDRVTDEGDGLPVVGVTSAPSVPVTAPATVQRF